MKARTLLIPVLMALLVAQLASAALVVSSATLGNDNAARNTNVSTTFTVQNTGNFTVNNLALSTTAPSSTYHLAFSGLPSFLNASGSATVTVTGTIPLNHPAVNDQLAKASFSIGSITASGNDTGTNSSTSSASADIRMQAENNLEFKKIKVVVNNGKQETLTDGDKLKNLKPSDTLDISITVENKFSDNEDVDIDNARVRVFAEKKGDLDIDEDDDVDVSADETEEVSFSDLNIEDDAKDGTESVIFQVDGTDKNGARHGELIKVKFEINRQTHEIRFDAADVSPGAVNCDASRTVRVNTRFTNIGKRDEKDTVIEVDAPAFNFNEKRTIGTLDEDDSDSASFSIPVPKSVGVGTYTILVNSYYEKVAKSDSEQRTVAVPDCTEKNVTPVTPPVTPPVVPVTPPVTPVTPPVVTPTVPVTPTAPTTPATPTGPRARVTTTSFSDSPLYVAGLAVATLLVLAVLVLLIVTLARRRPVE